MILILILFIEYFVAASSGCCSRRNLVPDRGLKRGRTQSVRRELLAIPGQYLAINAKLECYFAIKSPESIRLKHSTSWHRSVNSGRPSIFPRSVIWFRLLRPRTQDQPQSRRRRAPRVKTMHNSRQSEK